MGIRHIAAYSLSIPNEEQFRSYLEFTNQMIDRELQYEIEVPQSSSILILDFP